MSGAWEIANNSRVLVGILHVDTTTMAWSFGFRNLIVPGEVLPVTGMPFDHARNSICRKAIDFGFEHVFMFDSDVVPPRDAILRLLNHRLPVVSGMYCRRSPPHSIPVMLKDGKWITEFNQRKLVEVDLVGAGCLLIHRDVLLKLPPSRPQMGKHWFDWKVDCQGILPPHECLSEDFSFCKRVREILGIKLYVDPTIRCKHIGFGESDYGTFLPCNVNPHT